MINPMKKRFRNLLVALALIFGVAAPISDSGVVQANHNRAVSCTVRTNIPGGWGQARCVKIAPTSHTQYRFGIFCEGTYYAHFTSWTNLGNSRYKACPWPKDVRRTGWGTFVLQYR